MKTRLTAFLAFLACWHCVQAYNLEATISIDEEAKWHIDIDLADNDIDFTAFQFDIILDGEATLERDSIICSDLLKKHSLLLGTPKDGYRVFVYNMGNECLKEREGRLLSFTIDGEAEGICIKGITFVKPDGSKVEPDIKAKASGKGMKDSSKLQENEVVYDMKGEKTYKIDRRGICIRSRSLQGT